jgi:putative oxidoreductase
MMNARLSPPDAARRRSLIVQAGMIVAFAVVMYGAGALLPRVAGAPLRWLIAAGPVAVLAVWAWELFRMIRDDDEMMQAYHLRVVAISGMLVLLGGTMWGVLERLLGVPLLPAYLLLPVWAIVFGLVMTFVVKRP